MRSYNGDNQIYAPGTRKHLDSEPETSSNNNHYYINSNYYLKNASTHAGNTAFESPSGQSETGHAGNGYAKITYIGESLS